MEEFLLDFVFLGFIISFLYNLAFFIPIFSFCLISTFIKVLALINIYNKYKQDFSTKEILTMYFKDFFKYQVLLQFFINLISVYYSLFLDNVKLNGRYDFLIVFFLVLILVINYKFINKKYDKIFINKKMCKWYSFLVMPDITFTIVYNFVLVGLAYTFLYIT